MSIRFIQQVVLAAPRKRYTVGPNFTVNSRVTPLKTRKMPRILRDLQAKRSLAEN
jgi:hypothetical protein